VRDQAHEDREYPYRVAGDFLRLCGLALLAFAWVRTARVSRQLPESDPLRAHKLETAEYFFAYELPQVDYRIAAIHAARASLAFLD
ncbi:acyl-CoA dehydrogenase C-terminal domain-containing protein, partial [Pseudomonas sp. CCC2.2]